MRVVDQAPSPGGAPLVGSEHHWVIVVTIEAGVAELEAWQAAGEVVMDLLDGRALVTSAGCLRCSLSYEQARHRPCSPIAGAEEGGGG